MMAGYFWSVDEMLKRARSGEIESKELGLKWSYLNYGEFCTLNVLQISNPKGIPLHTHNDHDEVVQVLEGECEVTVGDETRVLKKGGTFFVPKGTPHGVKRTGTLLSVYGPSFDPKKPDRVFINKP
jgi:quercetin dioxygenase-like cupin family protein